MIHVRDGLTAYVSERSAEQAAEATHRSTTIDDVYRDALSAHRAAAEILAHSRKLGPTYHSIAPLLHGLELEEQAELVSRMRAYGLQAPPPAPLRSPPHVQLSSFERAQRGFARLPAAEQARIRASEEAEDRETARRWRER